MSSEVLVIVFSNVYEFGKKLGVLFRNRECCSPAIYGNRWQQPENVLYQATETMAAHITPNS